MANGEESREQQEMVTTPDGKYLLSRRRGAPPVAHGDVRDHDPPYTGVVVFWLLNAAGSGIVGTLAYDVLKQLIEKARKRSQDSIYPLLMQDQRLPRPARITPDTSMRDDLVELAYDILARYRNYESPQEGRVGLMSQINVFLTERQTWGVLMRELRADTRSYIEIPLREDGEVGFPVSIWHSYRGQRM